MEGNSPENDYHANNSQRAPSPDLFSSDDEEISKSDVNPQQFASASLKKQAEGEDLVLELESSRLQRLMALLQGVPPPPSVTIPQISLDEVLQRLKENADKLVEPSKISEHVSSLWRPNASLDEVLKTDWPEIKSIIFHDMHFNNCTASEDVEHISMKLHERFIGAETSTWCNAVTSSQPSGAKKRQRRSLGNRSPGCRLSHLARRRQTFSSANLAQLSSVAGSGTAGGAPASGPSKRLVNGGSLGQRCIMVEIKKTDKNKRIKTNSKEAMSKLSHQLPGSAPVVLAEVQQPIQSTKRALFQSPEEQKRAASVSQFIASDSGKALNSKRALWPSDQESGVNDNGKRILDKSDSSTSQMSKKHCSEDRAPYSRTTRSLPFPFSQNSNSGNTSFSNNAQANSNMNKTTRRASDQGPSSQGSNLNVVLSELHKRKLFWAITSALRTHNKSRSHPDFTRLTSILAFHYIEVRSNMSGPSPASTSEHMLKVVSVKAAEVLQAERAENSGQEENLGAGKFQKKEGSNKELFKDATASLNVRRSLCVSLTSSNHQLSDDKPKQSRRVPSARKSLTFDGIATRSSSGTGSEETMDKVESKYQGDSKANDSKLRVNGENIPLASAKRVSRSLFLSPKDEVKAAKKDACEQTCEPDSQSSTSKGCNETADTANYKGDDSKKHILSNNLTESCEGDERLQTGCEVSSSIPSVSAASSTLEADNEASRTSDATNLSEQTSYMEAPIDLAMLSSNIPRKEKGLIQKPSERVDSGSSESSEYIPARVLRGTKERAARQSQTLRRSTRKSLSLSRRELRSSSSDSMEQDHAPSNSLAVETITGCKVAESYNSGVAGSSQNLDPVVVLEPLKIPFSSKVLSPHLFSESNATSKSTFGSPPFIAETSLTPADSPFLGFPSSDDLNTSGEGADGSNSAMKAPDGSSEKGNLSQGERTKVDLEEKVITPLLEAAVLESSVCVGSGSSHSTDADLTFRGRIESLKPSCVVETAINLDLGVNLNVSANLLNMDENKEKSPVLEKWAERASRSAQKSCVVPDDTNDSVVHPVPVAASEKTSDHPAEESMLPWDESQIEAVSQCSTNMFEKFCSIFDPSSHQGNS